MANNRMYLVCECGARFYLAKYYPSTGWYWPALSYGLDVLPSGMVRNLGEAEDMYLDGLNTFFQQHVHERRDMFGQRFTLQYEH